MTTPKCLSCIVLAASCWHVGCMCVLLVFCHVRSIYASRNCSTSSLRDTSCCSFHGVIRLLAASLFLNTIQRKRVFLQTCCLSHLSVCCVTFAESEPYCHSILFVSLDVCQSFRDLQPTTIDRSQPNLVGRYIPFLGPM